MNERVVIVGAGPGGLASAMMLAASGVEVTVLERLDRVGGRTAVFELPGGYRFDLGPTFFLYPRVIEEIFASVGYDFRSEVPMKKLDPQYHLLFGKGGDILASPDPQRMYEQVARLNKGDADNLDRFMADNRLKLERFKPCLESAFQSLGDLVNPRMLSMLPVLRPWNSLDDELGRYFSDERVRLGFTFQSKYLGMSPFNCPSLFSILSFLEYEYGVFHPMGGCGAVSEAMARVARELGVDIRLSEPVEEVLFEGKRAVGVRTDRGTYMADGVVINADFGRAMKRMVPNELRSKWTDETIEKKRYSCSTFMLYLGLEGRYDHLQHHSIYMAEDYRRNLRDIEDDHVLSEDPSFYVQNPSVTDPSMAPEGHSAMYVLVPVTHRHPNVDWSKERDGFRARVLEQMEKKMGITGIEQRIRAERVITPDEWDTSYEIHKGATFNMAHNLGQMLNMRPQNRFKDLDGVYLVGGGTHPGSGLPVIYEGARISSRLLLQDLGLGDRLPTVDNPATRPAGPVSHPALERVA